MHYFLSWAQDVKILLTSTISLFLLFHLKYLRAQPNLLGRIGCQASPAGYGRKKPYSAQGQRAGNILSLDAINHYPLMPLIIENRDVTPGLRIIV